MTSNSARATVVAVAIGALVALFLILGVGDKDPAPSTTAVATTQTEGTTTPDEEERERPEPPPEPEVPTIDVKGGAPVGGVQKLEFTSGERILFELTSDVAAEFHLHGYDIEQSAKAGGSTTFDLPADIEGVFELEDHGTGAPIAEISVVPG